jgi:hypothetical protein
LALAALILLFFVFDLLGARIWFGGDASSARSLLSARIQSLAATDPAIKQYD